MYRKINKKRQSDRNTCKPHSQTNGNIKRDKEERERERERERRERERERERPIQKLK